MREALKKLILQRTVAFAAEYYPEEEADDGRPEAARKVEKLFESGAVSLGCKKEAAIDLIEALLDCKLKISDPEEEVDFEDHRLACVVPLGDDCDHHYDLGEPVILLRGDVGVDRSGQAGNHLTDTRKLIRPATPAEIDTLVSCLPSEVSLEITLNDLLDLERAAADL
jgi:hypothetical protein